MGATAATAAEGDAEGALAGGAFGGSPRPLAGSFCKAGAAVAGPATDGGGPVLAAAMCIIAIAAGAAGGAAGAAAVGVEAARDAASACWTTPAMAGPPDAEDDALDEE